MGIGSSTVGSQEPSTYFEAMNEAGAQPHEKATRVQMISSSVSVEYHPDDQIFLVHRLPDGSEKRELTTSMIVDAMFEVKKRAAVSNLSDISQITGTAPAGPIKEEEVDYSSLEWGDMDPNYRRELEKRPEVKAALQRFKRQSKAARLTPSGEFMEFHTAEIPAPDNPPTLAEDFKQREMTGDTLDSAIKFYHERHVQPSFNMLADAVTAMSNRKAPRVLQALNLHQMQLSNLEGEICQRTVLLHNIPPFANYSSIQGNLQFLCGVAGLDFHHAVQSCSTHILSPNAAILRVVFLQMQGSREFVIAFRKGARYWRDYQDRGNDRKIRVEKDVPFSTRLERQPYYALLDMLSDISPPPYGSTSFRTDLSSLQIKTPEECDEDMVLAQVVYLPFRGEFRCILLVQPDLVTSLQSSFGRHFNERMMSTLILLQAITHASTHTTTLARFHHTSSFDYSNVGPEEAFHMFPYSIEHNVLDPALADKLRTDPGFIHKGYGGLGQVVNSAQFARGTNPADYGPGVGSHGGDKRKGYAKGKGKGGKGRGSSTFHDPQMRDRDVDMEFQGSRDNRRRASNHREEYDEDFGSDERFYRHQDRRGFRDVRDARRDVRDDRRDVRDRSPSQHRQPRRYQYQRDW